MINRKTSRFLAIGLCVPACAALVAFNGGCSEEEPPPVVFAPPPPPPAPPPAPTVTPVEQLMAEMNIDPRVSLPEEQAPDNDVDRRAILSFFDGFARGNDSAVKNMLQPDDQPQLAAMLESGDWKDCTARIDKIDIQCGNSPTSDKCALAVFEVKGGGEMFQPQMWTYSSTEDGALFEAQACPPGIMDRLTGDWISRWFEILTEEMALADKADDEYLVAQRDLDNDTTPAAGGAPAGAPGIPPPGSLRPPGGAPEAAPGTGPDSPNPGTGG